MPKATRLTMTCQKTFADQTQTRDRPATLDCVEVHPKPFCNRHTGQRNDARITRSVSNSFSSEDIDITTVPLSPAPQTATRSLAITEDDSTVQWTARRCAWLPSEVQTETPGAISGLEVLKALSMASSDGMSPFLGPAAIPNGENGIPGC